MNIKNNKNFMLWTIVVLLIINTMTLTLLWLTIIKRPPQPPVLGSQESLTEGTKFLKKTLKLSEKQIQQFIESRNKHIQHIKKINEKNLKIKTQLLDEVFKDTVNLKKIEKLSNDIGKYQTEFEYNLYKHFLELKSYCNKEQQGKLKIFLNDMIMSFKKPPIKRR